MDLIILLMSRLKLNLSVSSQHAFKRGSTNHRTVCDHRLSRRLLLVTSSHKGLGPPMKKRIRAGIRCWVDRV